MHQPACRAFSLAGADRGAERVSFFVVVLASAFLGTETIAALD
jgi:hypothetical protein